MALGTTVISSGLTAQVVYGSHLPVIIERKAPPAITGENVYVVWTSNKTGHDDGNSVASHRPDSLVLGFTCSCGII